jgi:Tol biopolymer transport system component
VYLALASVYGPTGIHGLYAIGADGSGLTLISYDLADNHYIGHFKWSPDSTSVAYMTRDGDDIDDVELRVTTVDCSYHAIIEPMVMLGPVLPPDSVTFLEALYQWSSDGSYLAYMADGNSDNYFNLFSESADHSSNTRVNPVLGGGSSVFGFKWSPDGSRLAYLTISTVVGEPMTYYTVFPDGSGNMPINPVLPAGGSLTLDLKWSPDSSRIAYRARQESTVANELFCVMADGSNLMKINDTLAVGGNVVGFQWSPDGERIVYRADQATDEIIELYSSTVDGALPEKLSGSVGTPDSDVQPFLWIANSRQVVYPADAVIDEQLTLFYADCDDTTVLEDISQPLAPAAIGVIQFDVY